MTPSEAKAVHAVSTKLCTALHLRSWAAVEEAQEACDAILNPPDDPAGERPDA